MSFELWLAFVAAAAVVLVIPGPTITLVIGYALAEGRRSAWATVAGVALGDSTALILSLAGVGAILAASATLFNLVKLAGALYLVYLGIRLWRAEPKPPSLGETGVRTPLKMMAHAYAVTALNPKSLIFFMAFLPQFIERDALILPQLALLAVTFVVMATLNASAYAWLAGAARGLIRSSRVLKTINRIGGGVLVGAGLATAATLRRLP
jgi:threonine/homoserine/homoserine lactone efflux protein